MSTPGPHKVDPTDGRSAIGKRLGAWSCHARQPLSLGKLWIGSIWSPREQATFQMFRDLVLSPVASKVASSSKEVSFLYETRHFFLAFCSHELVTREMMDLGLLAVQARSHKPGHSRPQRRRVPGSP